MLQKSEIKISSHFALKKNVDFALPREKIVTTPIIPMENDSQYKNVEYCKKYLPALGTLRGITSSKGE